MRNRIRRHKSLIKLFSTNNMGLDLCDIWPSAVLSGFLTDTYTSNAASAISPMSFLRAVLSGIFPLFARAFFVNLKPNNALFVLAGCATAFCGVAAVFWTISSGAFAFTA